MEVELVRRGVLQPLPGPDGSVLRWRDVRDFRGRAAVKPETRNPCSGSEAGSYLSLIDICRNPKRESRCLAHWEEHGKGEGRAYPCAQDCYLSYCNHFPDLRNAFCAGGACTTPAQLSSCRTHWEAHGRGEGRKWPCLEEACSLRYCNLYPDLKDAFCGGGSCTSAHAASCRSHWEAHGVHEKRAWPCQQSCPLQYCNSFPV